MLVIKYSHQACVSIALRYLFLIFLDVLLDFIYFALLFVGLGVLRVMLAAVLFLVFVMLFQVEYPIEETPVVLWMRVCGPSISLADSQTWQGLTNLQTWWILVRKTIC